MNHSCSVYCSESSEEAKSTDCLDSGSIIEFQVDLLFLIVFGCACYMASSFLLVVGVDANGPRVALRRSYQGNIFMY
jgi:hypothetical protein